MKQKFKIGDRVRVTNALGTQYWAEGVEFTIEAFHKEYSFPHSSGWYAGNGATRYGEPFNYLDGAVYVGESGGIWEANLELVEPTLEEKLAKAKAEVESLEKQVEERDRVDLDALPNGSVVSTGYYYYVKTTKGWYSIRDVRTNRDVIGAGPFDASRMGNTKLIRKGI